ncbi:argininosuccinate synthase [Vulcanimicrobium alpinum]|uniref:Argininosuccinate synthase n=1 Tax=Vulcanimicrobium alpinum TaxID=3016050 RepID=A0AAN2C9F0_UNVUL|nr:argininosuccinate synthase [Vulcanimicrobium alpinum]BDE05547.1 argininosuccinate synthase [Vulcanimicrobium alpinum]
MKIVLAYSGGLDTSVLLKQFIDAGHQVVAMTLNLGESDMVAGEGSQDALEAVRQKALKLGAMDAVLIDARERFIADYAYKALAANALYEGVYPLSAALSRPLIADLLVETAAEYGADAVAHGCTGKGNDQVRIEVGVRAKAPHLKTLAPLRDKPLSRPDAIAYAQAHGVPIAHTAAKPYSVDANLWGRSIEAGVLENPWNRPPEDAYAWSVAPETAQAEGDEVVISFEKGTPSAALRQAQRDVGAEMVFELNKIAGRNGVGRIDLIEDRVVGLKSREVYECPGSVTLIEAHKALERLVLTRDELRFKASLDQKYAELIYDALWSSPLRDALDAFNAKIAERLTGEVRVRLVRGRAVVTGARSPFALYDESLATYGAGDTFRHDAAGGFIEIHGLPVAAGAAKAAEAAQRAAPQLV